MCFYEKKKLRISTVKAVEDGTGRRRKLEGGEGRDKGG
jgi:hypothetical protein